MRDDCGDLRSKERSMDELRNSAVAVSVVIGVGSDTKVVTASGADALAALHVGDDVTVSQGPGPSGEMAMEIRVTKAVGSA